MSPGLVVVFPSSLVMTKSGTAARVLMSVAVLLFGVGSLPLLPSSFTVAVLVIVVTPVLAGYFTV